MTPSASWADEVRSGFLTAFALVLLAAPLGLLWAHLTPHAALIRLHDGAATVGRAEGVIRADALFALVTGVAGLACGIGAWRLARRQGPGIAAGLAVGGLAGSLIARTVGRRLIVDDVTTTLRTVFHVAPSRVDIVAPPLAHAMLLAWALVSVATYLVLVAFSDRGF
jgi:hypothetical protein